MDWWLGAAMGVGVMGGHTLLRVLTHRLALRQEDRQRFLVIELGGLGARMLALLGAVALILTLVPVHEEGFVGAVLLLLVLSMAVETHLIFRRSGGDLAGR
jgi:hypothetical protein